MIFESGISDPTLALAVNARVRVVVVIEPRGWAEARRGKRTANVEITMRLIIHPASRFP